MKTQLFKSRLQQRLKRFALSEHGAATLEATLVFPLIIAVIVTMMLAAVYAYQLVYVQYISLTAAERASYQWDARDREFHTAQVEGLHEYGLYEHELSIILLRGLLPVPVTGWNNELSVSSSAATMQRNGKLINDKLAKTEAYLVDNSVGIAGGMKLYQHQLMPHISLELTRDITPLFWQQSELLPSPHYSARYAIHAPTQFIRNVDLFLYYAKRFASMTDEDRQKWKNGGGRAITSFSS